MATKTASQAAATAEQQLEGFINKFDSKNAALIRSARKTLRKRVQNHVIVASPIWPFGSGAV